MNHKDLETVLEHLAVEVRETRRAEELVPRFGEIPRGEAPDVDKEFVRVMLKEYCWGGYEDRVTEHEICLVILKSAVADMPITSKGSILYWRVRPEYSRQEEFMTGKFEHRVYCRLAWVAKDEFAPV